MNFSYEKVFTTMLLFRDIKLILIDLFNYCLCVRNEAAGLVMFI